MDFQDLLLIALRATLVYFGLLFVVRLMGKRSIGAIGAFDLLVALMLGEVVDEIIYGDVSLTKGFLVIGVIALWHYLNEWATYKSKTIARLTEAEPEVLVRAGKIDRQALARERMREEELRSQLRLQNIDKLADVATATLEPNGKVSVIKTEAAKTLQKGDLYLAQSQIKKNGSK